MSVYSPIVVLTTRIVRPMGDSVGRCWRNLQLSRKLSHINAKAKIKQKNLSFQGYRALHKVRAWTVGGHDSRERKRIIQLKTGKALHVTDLHPWSVVAYFAGYALLPRQLHQEREAAYELSWLELPRTFLRPVDSWPKKSLYAYILDSIILECICICSLMLSTSVQGNRWFKSEKNTRRRYVL